MRGTTQVGQYTSMVVDMCACVERYDTGRSAYKHGTRHVCVERYDTGRSYTSMVVDTCVLRGTTQVGQYTSMVVDMCERYDTGRSVYKHGSRHVCEVRHR